MCAYSEKAGLLLAAFGASGLTGEQTLVDFEHRVRGVYPELPVRWAFTSGFMRNKLAQNKIKADSVHKALSRMGFEKYSKVAVQSLHLICGLEYENMQAEAEQASRDCHMEVSIGKPLLYSDQDVEDTATALLESLPPERTTEDAVVCVGHGTWHQGAGRYSDLATVLANRGAGFFIGTLGGAQSIEYVLADVKAYAPKKVWLFPLLSLVGKHASIDIAGDNDTSWKYHIEKEGIPCTPILKGTAEYPAFISIWLRHLVECAKSLGI